MCLRHFAIHTFCIYTLDIHIQYEHKSIGKISILICVFSPFQKISHGAKNSIFYLYLWVKSLRYVKLYARQLSLCSSPLTPIVIKMRGFVYTMCVFYYYFLKKRTLISIVYIQFWVIHRMMRVCMCIFIRFSIFVIHLSAHSDISY